MRLDVYSYSKFNICLLFRCVLVDVWCLVLLAAIPNRTVVDPATNGAAVCVKGKGKRSVGRVVVSVKL